MTYTFIGVLSLISLICAVVILFMYKEAFNINVRRQELNLPNWPKGFEGVRFLLVSDIHRRIIPSHVREELNLEKIDLVLLAGDVTEKGVPLSRVEDNLSFLRSLAPTYFVWGNHDHRSDVHSLDSLFLDLGITVLANRAVLFEAGRDKLWLIGIDDYLLKKDDLTEALSDIGEEDGFRLLLSHNPYIVDQITKEEKIGGILSGHTHGGQICFPFLGAVFGCRGRVFPKIVSGEYLLENLEAKLFISNGLGTSKLPLRLLAPAEIHILTMKA